MMTMGTVTHCPQRRGKQETNVASFMKIAVLTKAGSATVDVLLLNQGTGVKTLSVGDPSSTQETAIRCLIPSGGGRKRSAGRGKLRTQDLRLRPASRSFSLLSRIQSSLVELGEAVEWMEKVEMVGENPLMQVDAEKDSSEIGAPGMGFPFT